MLKIDRVRVEIQTEDGLYGVDENFEKGLNFLASGDNTCGKSSILEAIYYGLGFEEIIGGKGEKVLTSAYKTYIENGDRKLPVLEAKIYLQISNGNETVTLYRTAKMENRDTKLITIYYTELNKIGEATLIEDTYVHMPNSAVNNQGFHKFLEKFLHLTLPKVPATDGVQRKLYLQLIFSCMFIEQKHGWGDLFSGMPILGIKDAKKRVLEFVMNLDTLNNEKRTEELKVEESRIRSEWGLLVKDIINSCTRETCDIIGLPTKPCVLSKIDLTGIHVLKDKQNLQDYIKGLKKKYSEIERIKPKVVDNFDGLQEELNETEETIASYEEDMKWLREHIMQEKAAIQILNDNLEIINTDLRNNKDAARLRELGSDLNCLTSKDICPVCHQHISDSLLPKVEEVEIMSIDENIRHLGAQKEMLEYAKESHRQNRDDMDQKIQSLQGKVFTLRRLAKTLRSDLYAVDDNLSEALVYKKIELQTRIDQLEGLIRYVEEKKAIFEQLSDDWKKYLQGKRELPENKFSNNDKKKLNSLRKNFVANLENYGYKSVIDKREIRISEDNYLPVIENFDMKFDSSASDNIRGIWAYTVALLQVSMNMSGNHPTVLIFDEPVQHSIIPNDMEKFLDSIVQLGKNCQTIIGITVKDSDTQKIIDKLDENVYHFIEVQNKAFQKFPE
ncbi:hypothetical protein [Thomasclavelia ramosa]|uniref:hypothetical protein n=1 Tax=Thomasclavelia ramosa TaxID=1547 RepID=UPI0025973D7B|nr:hypothetical protein [uncultured Thomasclavelia sp.]